MQSVSMLRRNLLLINAVLTSLVLWLALSFWHDAYVQKNDAEQLAENVEGSKMLLFLSVNLAEQRELFSVFLSAPDPAPANIVSRMQTLQLTTNYLLDSILAQVEANFADSALAARYNHTSFFYPVWSAEVDQARRRFDVYQQYSLSQLPLAAEQRDLSIRLVVFDEISKLISLVEQLKAATSFIPRHNEMETIDLHNLMSSIWRLSEAVKQESALLGELISHGVEPDSGVRNRLAPLQDDIVKARDILNHYGIRAGTSQSIIDAINMTEVVYSEKYARDRSLLLGSTHPLERKTVSHNDWLSVSTELFYNIDQLGALAHTQLSQLAEQSRAHGVRRLIVDSGLVVLCLIILIASIGLTRKIRHIAYHDRLTGLPNRYHFETSLNSTITTAELLDQRCAVLLLDLKRFKSVNDTFGNDIGDKLLSVVGARLQGQCRTKGMPARMGGDEFAFMLPDVSGEEQAYALAQALTNCVESEVQIDGVTLNIGLSVGMAISPGDGRTGNELLKHADIALFYAKKSESDTVRRYNGSMAAVYQSRIQTENDLRHALENNQLELHYQPQLLVDTGKVDCVEALLRWNHPERGMVSPGEFIPIAEEAGMLVELGAWVLDEACRQLAVWHEMGLAELRVAVNISPQQFAQDDFYDGVLNTLKKHNLQHRYLELEVTESIVMKEVERVVEILRKLRHSNIKIAVDDFGTGYSSLKYLQDLPLDILKIDKAFVDSLGTGDPKKSVANSIVQLGKSFDLSTIAEGVETQEQSEILGALGVQFFQGYFYSKPVAAGDVPDAISMVESRVMELRKAA